MGAAEAATGAGHEGDALVVSNLAHLRSPPGAASLE